MYKIIGADGKEYGPVTADQLRDWIAQGRANAQTRVQREGSPEWTPLGELSEFFPPTPLAPTPTPTLTPAPISAPLPSAGNNGMAVAAFVTSIVSLLCCGCGVILGPVAAVLGFIALSQLKRNPQQKGHGLATAGIIISIIAFVLSVGGLIYWLTHDGFRL